MLTQAQLHRSRRFKSIRHYTVIEAGEAWEVVDLAGHNMIASQLADEDEARAICELANIVYQQGYSNAMQDAIEVLDKALDEGRVA